MLLCLQGDTLQNALTDLENVLQTGFFKFLVEESGIYTPPRLVLEYNPFAHKAKKFASSGRVQLEKTIAVQEASKERPCGTSHTKTWDSGEISSFVQMLGLLDQEKTHHSEKITRFQHLNEVNTIFQESISNNKIFLLLMHTCLQENVSCYSYVDR